MKRTLIDLEGAKFGRLLVVKRGPNDQRNHTMWVCRCDCGSEITTRVDVLRSGATRSCGCLQKDLAAEKHTTHGQRWRPEYRVWDAMLQRCKNPNVHYYPGYGGRGISVCASWEKFDNFFNDMGERPSDRHSIERVDNDKGYSLENCKWATPEEQGRNTRLFATNTSGFKGVSWMPKHQKFQVYITANRKRIPLGYHEELGVAVAVRAAAEVRYWGKTA